MLRTRVISSIVGLALLAFVLFTNQILLGVGIFIVAVIGIYEFYNSVANIGYKPIRSIGYLSCIPILLIGMDGVVKKIDSYVELFKSINYFSFGIFVGMVILFCFIIFLSDKYTVADIALTVFGVLYVVFFSAFIVLTRNLPNGFWFIWFIFIVWTTDISAYFSGRFLGRTKLLPAISPKKTVEGAIGGVVGCVVATMLYGSFLNHGNYLHYQIPMYNYLAIGILNGIISQIGDWGASAIKRHVKIKDYGTIMPGHGGVLDRFDSILFIAPVVYFYISFIIIK